MGSTSHRILRTVNWLEYEKVTNTRSAEPAKNGTATHVKRAAPNADRTGLSRGICNRWWVRVVGEESLEPGPGVQDPESDHLRASDCDGDSGEEHADRESIPKGIPSDLACSDAERRDRDSDHRGTVLEEHHPWGGIAQLANELGERRT